MLSIVTVIGFLPEERHHSAFRSALASRPAQDPLVQIPFGVTAVSTGVFWADSGKLGARAIKLATDGPWGHMGIAFHLSDDRTVYYEALFGKGFRGPKPMARLDTWIEEEPSLRRACLVWLATISADESEQMRHLCDIWVGTRGYGELQLVMMFLSERYHIPVPRSPRRLVCSEAVSRLLAPRLDLRDSRRRRHDMVNPSSAWRRYLEIIAGYGDLNGPGLVYG